MQNADATDHPQFDEAGRRSNEFLRDFMKQQRATLAREAGSSGLGHHSGLEPVSFDAEKSS